MGSYRSNRTRGRLQSWSECSNGSSYPGPREWWLKPAQAVATAVDPDGVPSGGWAVIQNNGISGVREGALTVGFGEAGEGQAAISRYRCAGTAASYVVVGHHDLVGVIRVAPGERRRLVNVGVGLGAGDQVHVRPAIRQR